MSTFGLKPPIHLVKEFDNTVVFPAAGSEKFNPSALASGSTYEMKGSEQKSTSPHKLCLVHFKSAFEAYLFPRCPQSK